MIRKYFNLALVVTYSGTAAAITGMALAINGHFKYAAASILVAGICDMLDGLIARRIKLTEAQKEFGVQADSLADVVSFTVLPAVIFMTLGFTEWYHVIGYIMLVTAGITRLGHFNLGTSTKTRTHYSGMPVTYTSAIFPTLYLIYAQSDWANFKWAVLAVTVATAALFVSSLPFRKPSGGWLLALNLMAVALIAVIIAYG
ncbi:MAG: CDP-alcohol phosphatidyltransferase family protein [Candidatus Saccharimonadales bacterium]|nr:CDP-alcohol phosphatidyltransferase family protein [Candidatus Saccharimonadales bacterium]